MVSMRPPCIHSTFCRLPDAEERSLEQYIERAELEDELQWDDELLFNKQ